MFLVALTLLDVVLNIWLNLEKRYYLGGTFICDFRTLDGLSLGSSDKDIKCHHLTFYYSSSPLYYFSALNTTPTSHIRLCQRSLFPELKKCVYNSYAYLCWTFSYFVSLIISFSIFFSVPLYFEQMYVMCFFLVDCAVFSLKDFEYN